MAPRILRIVAKLVAVTAAIPVLSGCSGPIAAPIAAPTAMVTVTPTAIPTPETAAAVVIRGAAIEVKSASGMTLQTIPYSAGKNAVSRSLTIVLGSPERILQTDRPHCQGEHGTGYQVSSSRWGDLSLVDYAAGAEDFFLSADGRSATSSIIIEAPGGVSVGDPASTLVAAIPDATVEESTVANATYVWYDLVADGTTSGKSGALAYGTAGQGTIGALTAPESYYVADASTVGQGDC